MRGGTRISPAYWAERNKTLELTDTEKRLILEAREHAKQAEQWSVLDRPEEWAKLPPQEQQRIREQIRAAVDAGR